MKWTEKLILEDALKFERKFKWQLASPGAYFAARNKGKSFFQKVTLHMKKTPYMKWTKQMLLDDAKKFKTLKEWDSQSRNAARAAYKRGYLKEASKHFEPLGTHLKRCVYSITIRNTKIIYIGLTYNFRRRISDHLKTKRFKNLAKVYGSKNIISKKLTDYLSVVKAKKLEAKLIKIFKKKKYNVLNIAKAGATGGTTIIWTKQKIYSEIKKYKSLKEWRNSRGGSLNAAFRFGIYKEIAAKLERKIKKPWKSKLEVLKDAKKYKLRSEWKQKSDSAFKYAKKHNFFEEATAHMYKPFTKLKKRKKIEKK